MTKPTTTAQMMLMETAEQNRLNIENAPLSRTLACGFL
jgi:hypothetical protein